MKSTITPLSVFDEIINEIARINVVPRQCVLLISLSTLLQRKCEVDALREIDALHTHFGTVVWARGTTSAFAIIEPRA